MVNQPNRLAGVSRRALLALAGGAAAAGALPSTAAAAGRGRDVRVSGDGYLVHAEPSVAVGPRDHRTLLAACQVWDTDDSQDVIAAYVSYDGGARWHDRGPLPLPAGTTVADDVTVGFDPDGRGYVCAMAADGLGGGRGVYVWRTDDGGRTFRPPVAALAGGWADHPWLAADRTGRLHAAWVAADHAGWSYTRSLDHARTFEPPRTTAAPGGVAAPALAAGTTTVHLTFLTSTTSTDPGDPDDPGSTGDPDRAVTSGGSDGGGGALPGTAVMVASSVDGGGTFGEAVALGRCVQVVTLPGDVLPVCLPAVAAAPRGGAGYVAFVDQEPGSASSTLLVAGTADGGATWAPAAPVTPDDGLAYFQPQLAVDPAGRVALTAFVLGPAGVDVLLWTAPPGGSFGRARRVTERPFDPALGSPSGGKHGAWWIGDYQGLAVTPAAIHPLWNDTRTGHLELFTGTLRW
jgi:hypothetical protein